ncbi:Cys-tRNA(Pro) deacylase [Peribacillus glennii]|uniref:Cys-tRNA(Pro)/Cys-tRNA(Cys) deacylase n=1 Tax=Peribacillus glennii TaxID=2303991 RepID=A0A372L9V5_9BACI|nr:Cys-tRNA(Pro) deacylase [Peribacillus glennii]RFU62392.1 Cys-tRNA(Pro) deacylase [Peribacillus glennii]
MAAGKTNAMRILDARKIEYSMMSYDNKDGKIDGASVAAKIGRAPETVFKTLVAHGTQAASVYVFVIPVEAELDLKKAAKAAGEKKVEMLPVKDLQKWTGYIRGGCSPIGMKKLYPTFIDHSARTADTIIVSGGKIGIQIELKLDALIVATEAVVLEITK